VSNLAQRVKRLEQAQHGGKPAIILLYRGEVIPSHRAALAEAERQGRRVVKLDYTGVNPELV